MTTGRTSFRRPRAGFTLIEILVVVGIIVVLAGIALPMLMKSYKSAIVTRTRADLQSIALALEAYKADCGDYPRFDDSNAADASATPPGQSADPLNIQQDRGARLLCRALLGPGPAALTGGASFGFKASGAEQAPDGADGFGFRKRPGAAGTVYGPYVQSDKFKLGNSAAQAPGQPPAWDTVGFTDATLLDGNGHTILYYPAAPGNPQITGSTGAFVSTAAKGKPLGSGTPPTVRPLYNGFDNNVYGETAPPPYPYMVLLPDIELQYILGDRNNDGVIGMGETAATVQPYLLWTAGPTGFYGLQPATAAGATAVPSGPAYKCDAVCNFDIPTDLRK